MYSIIIADIAPMTPGNLTHFNWPRLLRNKPTYRVYYKTYHMMAYTCTKQENTENVTFSLGSNRLPTVAISVKMSRCQDDIFPRIELIPSFVLSSDNTNCKNDIQLFHQLFDELSVHTDYH